MKLEINYKKKSGKNTNTWRLNDMLLNNEWVNQEIKEEIKNTWRQMKVKTQWSKIFGVRKRRTNKTPNHKKEGKIKRLERKYTK